VKIIALTLSSLPISFSVSMIRVVKLSLPTPDPCSRFVSSDSTEAAMTDLSLSGRDRLRGMVATGLSLLVLYKLVSHLFGVSGVDYKQIVGSTGEYGSGRVYMVDRVLLWTTQKSDINNYYRISHKSRSKPAPN
jgi:hypothetical protein